MTAREIAHLRGLVVDGNDVCGGRYHTERCDDISDAVLLAIIQERARCLAILRQCWHPKWVAKAIEEGDAK